MKNVRLRKKNKDKTVMVTALLTASLLLKLQELVICCTETKLRDQNEL
jgi:hypothetical protein